MNFSPDEKFIVSCSYDNTIKIWDTATSKLIKSIVDSKYFVKSICISPDGTKIVSGSAYNIIKIYYI